MLWAKTLPSVRGRNAFGERLPTEPSPSGEIRYEKKSISIVDIEDSAVLQHHPDNGHHVSAETHQGLAF